MFQVFRLTVSVWMILIVKRKSNFSFHLRCVRRIFIFIYNIYNTYTYIHIWKKIQKRRHWFWVGFCHFTSFWAVNRRFGPFSDGKQLPGCRIFFQLWCIYVYNNIETHVLSRVRGAELLRAPVQPGRGRLHATLHHLKYCTGTKRCLPVVAGTQLRYRRHSVYR